MEQDFYKSKLIEKGINVIIPDKNDIEIINKVIYDELCLGTINSNSKKKFLEIVDKLRSKGAEGIILGCTEIGLLIKNADTDVPLFDTAIIHAEQAAMHSIK
jgi:aspartate racemase